jgi:hypothetical protein
MVAMLGLLLACPAKLGRECVWFELTALQSWKMPALHIHAVDH